MKKKLKRELEREALVRLEDAARTQADYENIVLMWDKLDETRARRARRYEIGFDTDELFDWESTGKAVIPRPIEHEWWRELLRGDFLDVIFDCPQEIPEMAPSHSIYEIVKNLNENQKEILYYWAIRLWSPQRIAAYRRQTDRNVLKVYTTLIDGLRKALYERLAPRYDQKLPLTLAQREFVEWYSEKLRKRKPPLTAAVMNDRIVICTYIMKITNR